MDAVKAYADVVDPVTQILQHVLPPIVAIPVSLSLSLFVPLYFCTALFFASYGYKGRGRWEIASALPSFVHGSVTVVAASASLWGHMAAHGGLRGDTKNEADDVLLMQFSCAYFLEVGLRPCVTYMRSRSASSVH
jgi:hypothetical protein